MNVFITGEIQIGKSTVAAKAAAALGARLGGFRTTFGDTRPSPNRSLFLLPAERGEPSEENAVVLFSDRKPTALTEKFDSLGPALLKTSCELILMDELGRFERDAMKFKRAVFEALEGDIPVLGVLRKEFPGWTGEVAAHPGVRVVTATLENRDELPALVLELLRH